MDIKNSNLRKIGIVVSVVFILWSIFFTASIISAMTFNPISDKYINDRFFKILAPQGWGFYSKNPRDSVIYVYDMNTEISAVKWPNSRADNFFGISRFGRSQGIEAGLIQAALGENNWLACDEKAIDCLKKYNSEVTVINTTPTPTICGDIGIVLQEPLPCVFCK